MSAPEIRTREEAQAVVDKIRFLGSCIDFDWKFEVLHMTAFPHEEGASGFMVRTTFLRPDINTDGASYTRGYGRWMHTPEPATEESLVKTAWLCCELIVRHELMEAFMFGNVKIFDPHHNIADLSAAAENRKRRL